MGELQQDQQALRDRLNKLLDRLKNHGFGQNQDGQEGQGQGQAQGKASGRKVRTSSISSAAPARPWAMPKASSARAIPTAPSTRRAARSTPCARARKAWRNRCSSRWGRGPGQGRAGRLGQPRAQQDTDPLGRPLRGRDYGDDSTVKVPGEIDVQRARRIIEELRKRFGDFARPQEELDYIERLLKDY